MRLRQPLRSLLMISLLAVSAVSHAFEPGKYQTKGNWGELILSNKGTFQLETVGGQSSCSLEGKVVGNKGFTGGASAEEKCELSFVPKGKSIEVAAENSACRSYCGASAEIDGLYSPVPPKKKK
ncbi:hypothetical protein LIN78_05070 [Leeia sp. TBRC 13508]|uniref:Uncharacterized protein n=1 Tax=Leeia speluncae TaxID=2884804 RepID=A0ABS8D3Z0_9NEIS|nr:hypothetical protein [Leeia speluncae]MCB6182919.1 hypothetical protein [Leeia speluncae]